jgi:hypothetical protein
MALADFQDRLPSLHPLQFEQFVIDVLRESRRFHDVSPRSVGSVDNALADVAAVEISSTYQVQKWFFEAKKRDLNSTDLIHTRRQE